MDSAHQHFAIAVGAARDQAKELLSQLERQGHGQTGKSSAMYLVVITIRGGPEPSSSSGREEQTWRPAFGVRQSRGACHSSTPDIPAGIALRQTRRGAVSFLLWSPSAGPTRKRSLLDSSFPAA